MLTAVCAIWSVIGLGVIFGAVWALASNSSETEIRRDDEISEIKNRLYEIQLKINADKDEDDDDL